MSLLEETIEAIKASDEVAKDLTRKKWDGLVKPIGSLGMLEEVTIKIAGMTGKLDNTINKRAIVVMCSDNGVVEEGVSGSPQFFTNLLTKSMAKGITGVSTLAKFTNTHIHIVDMGLIEPVRDDMVMDRRIGPGTKNFLKEPAMTREEAIQAIETGIEIGDSLYGEGYDILGTGELGIGNTTTSSAILATISGLDMDSICGMGGGLTREQFEIKKRVIKRAILLHKPNKDDPVDLISKVGGFDIGGMCGLFLSAAKNRKPIVIDGFISSVSALCAVIFNPLVKEYIIPSHLSHEAGAKYVMKELGLEPMVNLGMRLGEGSGCPLAFQIIDAALYTLENMGTFDEACIDSSILVDMREK